MIINLQRLRSYFIGFLACVFLVSVILVQSSIHTSAQDNAVCLPILMYHHVLKEEKRLNTYTVHPDEFEKDLKYIRDNGYTTVTVKDLVAFCEKKTKLPQKPIMITFDDGYKSVYAYAFPLLKQYNMKAVVNIIGKYTDEYSKLKNANVNYAHMSWNDLKTMSDSGLIEVANHSYNLHSNTKRNGTKKISGETLEQYTGALSEDLLKCQNRVKEELNFAPITFAYPFGQISKEALPVIKSLGMKAVFTCWEKKNYLTGDAEQLYHLNRFNRVHGISTEKFFKKVEK